MFDKNSQVISCLVCINKMSSYRTQIQVPLQGYNALIVNVFNIFCKVRRLFGSDALSNSGA